MGKFTPPDPRKLAPSRADPEHRGRRKELEKKHGYGYKEPLILAGIAVGLIWNIVSMRTYSCVDVETDTIYQSRKAKLRSGNSARMRTGRKRRSAKSGEDRGETIKDVQEPGILVMIGTTEVTEVLSAGTAIEGTSPGEDGEEITTETNRGGITGTSHEGSNTVTASIADTVTSTETIITTIVMPTDEMEA